MCFPELFWYAEFFAFENPVEVGNIVEPAFISNIGDGIGCVYKHPGGVP